MRQLGATLVLLFAVVLFLLYISWAISDAKRRGKSALFVLIAVTFFFPFGLLAWLLFRPDVKAGRQHRSVEG